jgi:hypothetical protein
MWRRQSTHGDRLVGEVRSHLRGHEWRRALRGVLVLLRYYPRGIAILLLNERRIERRMLARRLRRREQELRAYEQRLKDPLTRERREVQLLRERIRRLERRIRNLDRQS